MGKRQKKRKRQRLGIKPLVEHSQTPLELERLDPWRVRIRKNGNMQADGLVFLSPEMLTESDKEAHNALRQVANVAHLPGLIGPAMAMPDMHWGYGFPIGGVAAFDAIDGLVSPGGVGYDINCGCRLLATDLTAVDLTGRMDGLMDALFAHLPTGVGKSGPIKLTNSELKKVLNKGAQWCVSNGFGTAGDVEAIEDQGCLDGADWAAVGDRARERGRPQLGTLGSGNHFTELAVVEEIFDSQRAQAYGLFSGQLVVQIHSGSRGIGYQICDDALKRLARWSAKQGIVLPDRQLVYAPLHTPQAEEYFGGMKAAANFAYANRQMLTDQVRKVFERYLGLGPADLKMRLVIDVCHNIAKMETHSFEGQNRLVCVHRKGATRSFAAGRPELPDRYRPHGQPVLIPGDMGRASYVLAGREGAMAETFGSTCHGAGRLLSRTAAKQQAKGRLIDLELADQGITVRASGRSTLSEEMPEAYKDVNQVVEVVHGAGLSTKVVRLRPLGVIKG